MYLLAVNTECALQDPDGENARRALQRTGTSFQGSHASDVGSGLVNLPPSILNNPNIPPEVISNLQAGRLGSTIFVANVSLGFSLSFCCSHT